MLRFKIIPHILAKGYVKPYTYLCRYIGFSPNKAVKFTQDKQKSISLADLSHLCATLGCTPNELFYWEQTASYTLPDNHPCIAQLPPPDKYANWQKAVQQLDNDEKEEVYQLIQSKIKARYAPKKV